VNENMDLVGAGLLHPAIEFAAKLRDSLLRYSPDLGVFSNLSVDDQKGMRGRGESPELGY